MYSWCHSCAKDPIYDVILARKRLSRLACPWKFGSRHSAKPHFAPRTCRHQQHSIPDGSTWTCCGNNHSTCRIVEVKISHLQFFTGIRSFLFLKPQKERETTDLIILRQWPPSRSFIQAVTRGFINLISVQNFFDRKRSGVFKLCSSWVTVRPLFGL